MRESLRVAIEKIINYIIRLVFWAVFIGTSIIFVVAVAFSMYNIVMALWSLLT